VTQIPRRRYWIFIGLAAACALDAGLRATAQVYRYKDDHGNWVYADRPSQAGQSAQAAPMNTAAASPRILVEARSAGGTSEMVAINECRCVVEFLVKATGGDGLERMAKSVVPERSRQVLLVVPAPTGTGSIAFEYAYVIGQPGAVHTPPRPYRAPFALAQSFTVTQAPPDAVTHIDRASRNAIDIAMPVGTPVHAARDGLVINVARSFFRGGTRLENRDEANFVQILQDDGTTAIYAHLQMDTIRVRPGQRVQRGENIANSGNTGFSSGPHLHFVVVRNAGLEGESVPVVFAGPAGSSVVPHSGSELTAY
jgi:murein DD-endopeptidase MepM/ murein hydrolase activator NlpD